MTKKHAVEAVIAAAQRAEARADGKPVEQLELMPPSRFDPVDDERRHRAMNDAVRRDRRGRPPGATNRATRDMLDFIRKTMGDPLLESARWAMHTPASLAAELGCTLAEAFDRLETIRRDLRPYFYAKQAPVDADGKPVPGLTVEFHGQSAPQIGPGGAPLPPWLYDQGPHAQLEQNQQLIDITPTVSDGAKSDETPSR
jgi:hypothetical protein